MLPLRGVLSSLYRRFAAPYTRRSTASRAQKQLLTKVSYSSPLLPIGCGGPPKLAARTGWGRGGGHPRPCVDGARSTTGRAGSRVASGKSPAIGALMQCGKRARALPCKRDVGFIFFWGTRSVFCLKRTKHLLGKVYPGVIR